MDQILMTKGFVSLEIKNVTESDLQRLRNYFTQLVNLQIHQFKNGKIILHFDNKGDLMKIDVERVAWKRSK